MWKLVWLFFMSACSQNSQRDAVRDALQEQRILENIRPILDMYISHSLERHKNSLLGLCTEMIADSEKHIEMKIEQILRATTTTPAPRVCDQGWISSPEKCYYVSSTAEKTDWPTAIERCAAKGAKLVEIQTDEEASFIMRNLPARVVASSYICTGRERNDDNIWVFASNDKVVDMSVRTWADGEPDGNGKFEPCGCTRKSDDLLMYDCRCTGYNIFYICEIVR